MQLPLRAVSTEEAGDALQPCMDKKEVTLGKKRQDKGQAHTGPHKAGKSDHGSSQHQKTTCRSAGVEADGSTEEGVTDARGLREDTKELSRRLESFPVRHSRAPHGGRVGIAGLATPV